MSSCCRLAIHVPMDMDVLLPEDPQGENNASSSTQGKAESLDQNDSCTIQEKERDRRGGGSDVGGKKGELGAVAKQKIGESREGEASSSAQASKGAPGGKHASGRKPRTKGLIKKLQEQVSGDLEI